MRRAEELQDWIAQVTEQPVEDEHLSVVLQDGQLLCLLANAVDPSANLKVNKLTTVFHSKANVRAFLDWCRRQGIPEPDLFDVDDLLDGLDFVAVVTTLSILYDKYSVRYSEFEFEADAGADENPLSDSESYTSETSSSNRPTTPTTLDDPSQSTPSSTTTSPTDGAPPPGAATKLTSFMMSSFLNRKKAKPPTPRSPAGTPPSTPPPLTGAKGPATPPPPAAAPAAPAVRTRTDTAGSNNSRLNAFLSQVPASHEKPLEHVGRPAGPAKRPSSRQIPPPPRSPVASRGRATPPSTPPRQAPSTPPRTEKKVNDGARNKFAAFMRANPPALGETDAVAPSTPPRKPMPVSVPQDQSFAQRKAMFSPKKAAAAKTVGPNNPPRSAPSAPAPSAASAASAASASSAPASAPMPVRKPSAGTENNKLRNFMSQQPSSTGASTKARSDSSQSKLAAFLATTSVAPSISRAPSNASSARGPASALSSFQAKVGGNGGAAFAPRAPTPQAPAAVRANGGAHKPLVRSSGRCTYVRKRQTYWQNRPKRVHFSLEEKRKLFMNNQLELKEEQLRQEALGEASAKQNLIVPGVQCYVPDKEEVWMLSEIVDYNDRSKQVTIDATLDSGETERRVVDLKNPDIIRAVGGPSATEIESLPVAILHDTASGVEDMRLLRYLNEPSILFNLKQRFEASKPYTYTNDIVIAVNPYKWIDGLYGDHLHDPYLHKERDTLPPHVYSTSTAAYKHLKEHEMNQSILVSGESGAGKTETTKIVMNHLASVAGGRKDKTIAKVIDVNPLLESFGNAKTTRNDNSSRFGKFTQLQFNQRGKLIGAKCETYLLEKSRVVSIADGERNYHIFYQMLAGFSKREQEELHLDSSIAYQYSGALSAMKIPGLDDAEWLEGTRKSLSLIEMNANDQKSLFQILSGILLLGEVDFMESGESGSSISTTKELSHVAELFGVPSERIQEALCNRTVITRNDAVTVPLDPVEAVENRDALAKTIYSKMFDWMVQKINIAISSDENEIHGQIGVLDIFGFEDFAQNGFEQFCINYANEKLQQKFTTDVFKTVEDEYIREGLEWDHIQYQDNKDIVDIIDGKMGIIALMNDHLRQPRGTEEALVNKFKTNHYKKNNEVSPHIDFPKVKRTQFIINHYAGSVTYETVGFMEKHRDTLQKDLLDLLQSSKTNLLVELFRDSEPFSDGGRSKSVVKSLGTQFKFSLSQLMENISSTNSHYVRCIKPNSNKSSTEFNNSMIVEQLRSAGVVEAIRITRSAYPSRLTPQELASRYCIMFPPSMHSKDVRRTCSVFMTAIGRKAPLEYQMGNTLIYFKNGVMEELEAMKSDFMYIEATCIQKIALGFIYRRRLARQIRAALVLQSYTRMAIDQKEYHRHRRAIIRIQRAWTRYITVPPEPVEMPSFAQPEDVYAESNRSSDGGQWVDEMDEFDGPPSPSRPPSGSMMDRMRSFKNNEYDDGGMKRIGDLSMRAKSFMRNSCASSVTGSSSGMALEEENAMLRIENRNLKYDLELMREQCIELQAIILEINKSRKR